ncbi:MAG: hypothetical protein AAES65_11000 [Candidatus Thiodiazotropha sp. (ex. Lucinoma kazani)]
MRQGLLSLRSMLYYAFSLINIAICQRRMDRDALESGRHGTIFLHLRGSAGSWSSRGVIQRLQIDSVFFSSALMATIMGGELFERMLYECVFLPKLMAIGGV